MLSSFSSTFPQSTSSDVFHTFSSLLKPLILLNPHPQPQLMTLLLISLKNSTQQYLEEHAHVLPWPTSPTHGHMHIYAHKYCPLFSCDDELLIPWFLLLLLVVFFSFFFYFFFLISWWGTPSLQHWLPSYLLKDLSLILFLSFSPASSIFLPLYWNNPISI